MRNASWSLLWARQKLIDPAAAKRWIFISLAVFMLLASSGVAAQAQFRFGQIVVFGTSISDPGNVFVLTGQSSIPPYNTLDPLLIPNAPYAIGGHHFSNGETWIEQLARAFGFAKSTRSAFQQPRAMATNYAVGGARARDDTSQVRVNLSDQVNAFLQDFNGDAPSHALYVVEMGVNDIRDALTASNGALIAVAIDSIRHNIEILHEAGANKFLLVNAPNLGLLPAIHQLDSLTPGVAQAATSLTQAFNASLDDLVNEATESLPDIKIAQLDVYRKIQNLVATPADFGLTEVKVACVTPGVPPFSCQRPDEYLFWDGIHPTRAVHAIFAHEAALVLTRFKTAHTRNPMEILSCIQTRNLHRCLEDLMLMRHGKQ